MPSMVCEFDGYRIAIYSPSDHYAIITPPGGNRVIELGNQQPPATVVEGPLVCLTRAQNVISRFARGKA